MIAYLFKNSEAVGLIVHRGFNKRNLVKSNDVSLKGRLNRLYNSSFNGLTYNYEGTGCDVLMKQMAPGTQEHFLAVSHEIAVKSHFQLELVG